MAVRYWLGTTSSDPTVAANWSGSTVPITGDTVYITDTDNDLAAADQSAVLLAALYIHQSYTGNMGSATAYWQIGATKVVIGYESETQNAAGSSRIMLNLGTNASTISVYNSGTSSSDVGKPPIRLLNINAASTLSVYGGKVGVACNLVPTETSTILTTTVSGSTTELTLGPGVTLTTLRTTGGTTSANKRPLSIKCDGGIVALNDPDTNTISSLSVTDGGNVVVDGACGVTSINIYGGFLTWNATGTLLNLNIFGGFTDLAQTDVARTVGDCQLNAPGSLNVDSSIVTFTNPIVLGTLTSVSVT